MCDQLSLLGETGAGARNDRFAYSSAMICRLCGAGRVTMAWMSQSVRKVVRFDRFVLYFTRGCLATRSRRSTSQGLPGAQLPRATLAAWSRKQEMLDAVWAGVVVTDESLVQSIRQLRQKLGDQGHRLSNSRAPSAI
jgi:hypothetical protein